MRQINEYFMQILRLFTWRYCFDVAVARKVLNHAVLSFNDAQSLVIAGVSNIHAAIEITEVVRISMCVAFIEI